MMNPRKIVLAAHDDGTGAFAVLCRLARALVHVADTEHALLHMYFLNSSAAKDGQDQLKELVRGSTLPHQAVFVPTDNLIWLPKDPQNLAVLGRKIPDILRKWIAPLWHSWPCDPNWIRPHLPIIPNPREDWPSPRNAILIGSSGDSWVNHLKDCGTVRDLTPEFWRSVVLGISFGVPQLHGIARREGFSSVEFGDWFFSVGLRGCMNQSPGMSCEDIASTESYLRLIEQDEFKAREFWGTLYQSPRDEYLQHLTGSPVRFNMLTGALWSGDAPPDDLNRWPFARIALRDELISHFPRLHSQSQNVTIAYLVTGATGVWSDVIKGLKATCRQGNDVAVIGFDPSRRAVTLLEQGGDTYISEVLKRIPSEERHLAICAASDFGVTRSAGGVLGFAATRRPSVLVDEPGHWLGDIQVRLCSQAGLCHVVPVAQFRAGPPSTIIQDLAVSLGTGGPLAQVTQNTMKLPVGAERDLAEYLYDTYIE